MRTGIEEEEKMTITNLVILKDQRWEVRNKIKAVMTDLRRETDQFRRRDLQYLEADLRKEANMYDELIGNAEREAHRGK